MDSDCDGGEICDDVLGTDVVRDDGSYEVTEGGGDPDTWSWSRPDVYARILFKDDLGVRLTDEMGQIRGASTGQQVHDDIEGSVNPGFRTAGTDVVPPGSTQCGAKTEFRSVLAAHVKPAMLQAPLAQAVLVRQDIARTTQGAWEKPLAEALAKGRLDERLQAMRGEYDRQARLIAETAFRGALAALDDLPDGGEEVKASRADLRQKAATFDRLNLAGGSLPPQMTPRESAFR
jgi:hypothetical protein